MGIMYVYKFTLFYFLICQNLVRKNIKTPLIMSKFNVSVDCVVLGYDYDLELKVLLITKENPKNLDNNKIQLACLGSLK